jgi:hypothetical protein
LLSSLIGYIVKIYLIHYLLGFGWAKRGMTFPCAKALLDGVVQRKVANVYCELWPLKDNRFSFASLLTTVTKCKNVGVTAKRRSILKKAR